MVANPLLAIELTFSVEPVLGLLVKVVVVGDTPQVAGVVASKLEHAEVESDVIGRLPICSGFGVDHDVLGHVIEKLSPE